MPPTRVPRIHSTRIGMLVLVVLVAMMLAVISLLSPSRVPRARDLPATISGATLVEIGTTWVSAEIASTDESRERGLSGRSPLGPQEGMLFIHPKSGLYSYWMKDMLFPLDIIWIDADRRVVGVAEHLDPSTYPEMFTPPLPVLYVLEVPAGFAESNAVTKGTYVAF